MTQQEQLQMLSNLIAAWFKTGKSDESGKPSIPPELFNVFKTECGYHQCLSIMEAFYSMAKSDAEPTFIENMAHTILGILNDRLKVKTGNPAAAYTSCDQTRQSGQTRQSDQTDLPSETDVLNRLNNLHGELRQLKVSTDICRKFDMLFSLIEGEAVYAKWPVANFGSPNVGAIVARSRKCTAEIVLIRVKTRLVFGLTFEVVPLCNTFRSAMHANLRRKMWLKTLPDDLIRYIETGHNDGNLHANLQNACKTGAFGMSNICDIVMNFLNEAYPIARPFSSKALQLAYTPQPYRYAVGRLNEVSLNYGPTIEEARRIDGLLGSVAQHTGVVSTLPGSKSFLGYGSIKVIDQGFPQVGTMWYSTDVKGRIVEHQVMWRGLFTMTVRETVIHKNGDRQVTSFEM